MTRLVDAVLQQVKDLLDVERVSYQTTELMSFVNCQTCNHPQATSVMLADWFKNRFRDERTRGRDLPRCCQCGHTLDTFHQYNGCEVYP